MEFIAGLCQEFDALCFTDEIYEHILYPREDAVVRHISMAQIDGMRDRTVIVNSMSKTYSVTGWRVGYCIAPPEITSGIRKVHDFLTVGAAAPLQSAGVGGSGVQDVCAGRRLLHHDRHLELRLFGRRRVYEAFDSRSWCGLRAGIEFLQRPGAGPAAGAVLFL
jgi:aspartate/methionine/tyrosine aminotransferase